MKEKIITVQLRSTIFLQQTIGYTPENAENFRAALLPEGKILGANQPGIPFVGFNPNMPQYGMPWRIFKKRGNDADYNIVFLPNKIDIILSKEAAYDSDVESEFLQQSISWFGLIQDMLDNCKVQRIAYAPLYAITEDSDVNVRSLWKNILRTMSYDGIESQDVNVSFLLKKQISFGESIIQMNLLHNIFDGIRSKLTDGKEKIQRAFMVQLDLNSVPEIALGLDKTGVSTFFKNILPIKSELIDNVIQ